MIKTAVHHLNADSRQTAQARPARSKWWQGGSGTQKSLSVIRILGFASSCHRMLGAFAKELGTRQFPSHGPLPVRFRLTKSVHEAA